MKHYSFYGLNEFVICCGYKGHVIKEYLANYFLHMANVIGDETFCMTYGDGVSDLDIEALVAFHREQQTLATLTAIQPPGRFGSLSLGAGQGRIDSFREKPNGDGAWANGGFFVLEPEAFDYIDGDETVLEREPLERLAEDGQLSAYRHGGYWQSMDTLRDKHVLDELWASGEAPWKLWRDA